MKIHTFIYKPIVLGTAVYLLLLCVSCKRQDEWLNVKRNISDVTPTTVQDFQAILDQNNIMNGGYPQLGLVGTDNILLNDANLKAASAIERNAYIFAPDVLQGANNIDWYNPYQIVEYSNVVLDGLKNLAVNSTNATDYNTVKGSALFFRSLAFYNLAQFFSAPYSKSTAATDLGIPIRLSSDVNIPSVRGTIQQTYGQILSDLQTAANLLPVTPLYKTRPSQAAANALLAKVYLDMEDYVNSGKFADITLSGFSSLLDYNSSLVNPAATYRFPTFTVGNPEIIFYAACGGSITIYPNRLAVVDTNLYKLYAANDLRKTILFKDNGGGQIRFQGTYTGVQTNFAGIAANELYLIRAECYARAGNTIAAMNDLNTLLAKRWKTGTFVPVSAASSSDALAKILTERRKELPFTSYIRWADLRRLNKDPNFSVTVAHNYNGTNYTLLPNDKRYVLPIPDQEIQFFGLPQNSR